MSLIKDNHPIVFLNSVVTMEEDFAIFGETYKKDETYATTLKTAYFGDEICIELHAKKYGNVSSHLVPISLVKDKRIEIITPKYKIGEHVMSIKNQKFVFTISSFKLKCGKVWYNSNWGTENGMDHGAYEDEIEDF